MIPWAAMLQAGVRMGISPDVFWRLSLREWRMLTAAPTAGAPPDRATLERLAEAWPDD